MACIGIDLGTTNCCVGVWQNGRVEIIANDQGSRTTPSYVAFDGKERFIGQAAKSHSSKDPANTVFDAKRLIGRKFNEASLQEDIKHFPFKVVNRNDQPVIQVDYMNELKEFRPEEISSMILGYLKNMAEAYLGEQVIDAIITVPAYFNDSQRRATKDAGQLAGLNVKRVINEPTAAAIAYGLDKNDATEKHVLVFDMGGGTFDVSLLSLCEGFFQVKATAGDTHLGGEDFDNIIVDHVVADFKKKHKKLDSDPSKNKRALRRLRTQVENAKKILSTSTVSAIDVDSFHEGIDLNFKLTRAKFESLCDGLFKKSMNPVIQVLKDANISKDEIDEIVMVGGSTRIPRVQQLVSELFGGKKLNMGINPDEAVAYGAAVNAAILSDRHKDDERLGGLILLDVAPLSLGVETEGGVMDVLIPRQTTIPHTDKKLYSTAKNNQDGVTIQVYEGERKMTKDNNKLGEFQLSGIPPMPRGQPQVEVSFSLDVNGILTVSAVEKSTGRENKIQIKNQNGRMSKEDIDRKLREAEEYRAQDELNLKKVQLYNELESYFYAVMNSEETIKNLSSNDKTELQQIAEQGLEWIENHRDADPVEFKAYRDMIEPQVLSIYNKYRNGNDPSQTEPNPDPELEVES